MSQEYNIRKADISNDRLNVLNLWRAGGFSSKSIFDWYYNENTKNTLYVLTDKNDVILGTISYGIRKLNFKGNELTAGILGNYFIDKNHRTLRPALILLKWVLNNNKNNIDLFYGFPRKKAEALFKYAGLSKKNSIHRHAKIIKINRYLSGFNSLVSIIFSPSLNYLIWLRDFFKTFSLKKKYSILDDFDEGFDYNSCSKNYVISNRDYNFLNWRFIKIPEDDYRIFAIKDHASRMCGYVVYTIHSTNDVEIMDFMANHDPCDYKSLLLIFASYIRKHNINSIMLESYENSSVDDELKQAGFVKREGRPVYMTKNDNLFFDEDFFLTQFDENSRN